MQRVEQLLILVGILFTRLPPVGILFALAPVLLIILLLVERLAVVNEGAGVAVVEELVKSIPIPITQLHNKPMELSSEPEDLADGSGLDKPVFPEGLVHLME